MTLNAKVHAKVGTLLERASQEIILPYFRNLSRDDVEEKSPGDLVTIADRRSEEMLAEGLHKILPDAAIVGEEAVTADPQIMKRLGDDSVWIIDPIDGTGNFAAGRGPFGILIALAEQGQIIAGWIYDPVNKRLCHAELGGGAFVNGQQIRVLEPDIKKPVAALATGFMTEEQRESLLTAATPYYEIAPIPNCAAAQYPYLVTGEHQLTVFERTLPWDHAAGVLFLNEAGGKAARWDGSDYRITDARTGMLAASTPKLWDEAASILSHIFTE